MILDNLPIGEVGEWALEKHTYLERYIRISCKTRAKYLSPLGKGGATYVDLFCGAGRSRKATSMHVSQDLKQLVLLLRGIN